MGVFSVAAAHQRLQCKSRVERRGVKGLDKVPQLFFVFYFQAVTLNDYLPGPKQEWPLLSNEYSNTFIWPSKGHISDKGMGRADIPISKEPAAGQRELAPRSFQRNTPEAGR